MTSAWNHNTLSLQYKLDNEFELIFVVAYQNILKLTYIDKFLTEIALRFRDKYKQDIVSCSYGNDFGDFRADFDEILEMCEREAERRVTEAPKPRKFEESAKASKTVGSMIETKKTGGILGSIVNTVTGTSPVEKKPGGKHSKHENGSLKDDENTTPPVEANQNGYDDFDDFEKRTSAPATGKAMRKFEPRPKGYSNKSRY